MDKKGFIRSIEHIGTGDSLRKFSAHGLVHRNWENFLIKFDTSTDQIKPLNEIIGRDVDVIVRQIYKENVPEPQPCTLHEEILPPAYRKEVIQMMKIAKSRPLNRYTYQFKYNSGLDYYPFSK